MNPTFNGPDGISNNYGFFHVYSFTMTMAILITALLCYIKFKRRNIPAQPVLGCLVIVIPFALLGASFFGKLNGSGTGVPSNWWTLFYFWNGGLSIHGGILFGATSGVLYFAIFSRRYKVSMWVYVDVILPNILIGQVIGRWGNFFNHELLGDIVSKGSLDWLPAFIRDNCFKLVNGVPEMFKSGHIVYRQPIFLYESFANFWAWAIITFVVPNIGRWIGRKPNNKLTNGLQYSWCYNMRHFFSSASKRDRSYISYREWWNRSFFETQPTLAQTMNKSPNELQKAHNQNKYWITRCGVEAGMYFFLWNGIRLILETHRQNPADLFLPYNRELDYAMIGLFCAIGLVLVIVAQFVLPHFNRKVGWKYEKTYSDLRELGSWQYKLFAWDHMEVGVDNIAKNFKKYITHQTSVTLGVKLDDKGFDELFRLEDVSFAKPSGIGSFYIKFTLNPSPEAHKRLGITKSAKVILDLTEDVRILKKPWRLFKKTAQFNKYDKDIVMFSKFLNSPEVNEFIKRNLQKDFIHFNQEEIDKLPLAIPDMFNNAKIDSSKYFLIIDDQTVKTGSYFQCTRNTQLLL